jgi:hypothetical protein
LIHQLKKGRPQQCRRPFSMENAGALRNAVGLLAASGVAAVKTVHLSMKYVTNLRKYTENVSIG